MRLLVAGIGRLKGPEQELCARYAGRIRQSGAQSGFSSFDLLEFTESRKKSVSERKADEARLLDEKIPAGSYLIALDERGKHLTSRAFAGKIEQMRDAGSRSMVFALGGADGFDAGFLRQASFKMSLGALTLPHGLARVVLMEQIYRALMILQHHPYHRD